MSQLLGPDGRPISSSPQAFRKAKSPILGEAFTTWAGRDISFLQLPGGGVIQFDLSKLTIADYRVMRDNYQINASLSMLTFMLHQVDWTIECTDKKIATFVEENLRQIWSQIVRSLSMAFWAGYSPNILQYENDLNANKIVINKIKDMVPEEVNVNWKKVDGVPAPGNVGSIPPRVNVYDGIKVRGMSNHIPVENTLWYPLLMEQGDYYGRKLLKAAFVPYFFSTLIHLFSNRYFERFGEPVPVGRAPYDDEITVDGDTMAGNQLMLNLLSQLRSRSVVVLPSDRSQIGIGDRTEYDYDIEYLESQMRGADFARYMSQLDEEMSLALFTPLLMLRTADVGSYNLGETHSRVYSMMLNAVSADWKEYLDKYLLARLVDYNYGVNAPRATLKFRKLGMIQQNVVQAIFSQMTKNGQIKYDVRELGQLVGLTTEEIKVVLDDEADDAGGDPKSDPRGQRTRNPRGGSKGTGEPRSTGKEVLSRVTPQVEKAWREGKFGPGFEPSLGFQQKFKTSLITEGWSEDEATTATADFYSRVALWLNEAIGIGQDAYEGPNEFMRLFANVLDTEVDHLAEE